jgi:hypothetical protein
MSKHLEANEFVNLMEGLPLPQDRSGHLDDCPECRSTLSGINELHEDVSTLNEDLPDVDWTALRSSVRDRLLSRAVQRSSVFQRWTGWTLRPAMAWSLAFVVLIAVVGAGTLRHYQTQHPAPSLSQSAIGTVPSEANDDSVSVIDTANVFDVDDETIEAEAMAWSQTDIFSELDELEISESELLRELIASAEEEDFDLGLDEGIRE